MNCCSRFHYFLKVFFNFLSNSYMSTCQYLSRTTRHFSLLRRLQPRTRLFSRLHPSRTRKNKALLHPSQPLRDYPSMPASQVELSTDNSGVFHVPNVTSESAAKASEVLQENHEKHHIFFNASGFHSSSASDVVITFGEILTIVSRSHSPSHADSLRSWGIS